MTRVLQHLNLGPRHADRLSWQEGQSLSTGRAQAADRRSDHNISGRGGVLGGRL